MSHSSLALSLKFVGVCVFVCITPFSFIPVMNGKNSVHEWLQPNKLIQNDSKYTKRQSGRAKEKELEKVEWIFGEKKTIK